MKCYRTEKVTIHSDGKPMRLLVLRPKARFMRDNAPCVLWIHGGGYVTGMAGMVHMSRAVDLIRQLGAVVISPEYRLAGRHPFPSALNDCYQALTYMRANVELLGCNPSRLIVGGESAGGGLAAAVCIMDRNHGMNSIALQLPLYPMLDNRGTPSSLNNHGLTWNTRRNHAAWKVYLRDLSGSIPPIAAPARETDYACLPPCYTFVGSREAFYCETQQYVANLQAVGIEARCDVYSTGMHAFDMLMPWRQISRKAAATFARNVEDMLKQMDEQN